MHMIELQLTLKRKKSSLVFTKQKIKDLISQLSFQLIYRLSPVKCLQEAEPKSEKRTNLYIIMSKTKIHSHHCTDEKFRLNESLRQSTGEKRS